jgi:hypothetical protein
MTAEDKSRLHNEKPSVESKEGERRLLSSNEAIMRSPSLGVDEVADHEGLNPNAILTPKTIEIFTGFAATLKKIHIRLVMEGYTIKAGKIYKPGQYNDHETKSKHNSTDRR